MSTQSMRVGGKRCIEGSRWEIAHRNNLSDAKGGHAVRMILNSNEKAIIELHKGQASNAMWTLAAGTVSMLVAAGMFGTIIGVAAGSVGGGYMVALIAFVPIFGAGLVPFQIAAIVKLVKAEKSLKGDRMEVVHTTTPPSEET